MKKWIAVLIACLMALGVVCAAAESAGYKSLEINGFTVSLPNWNKTEQTAANGYIFVSLVREGEKYTEGYYVACSGVMDVEIDDQTLPVLYSSIINAMGYSDVQTSDLMINGEKAQLWTGYLPADVISIKNHGIIYFHKDRFLVLVYMDDRLSDDQKEEEILRAAKTVVPAFDSGSDLSAFMNFAQNNQSGKDSSDKKSADSNYSSVFGMTMGEFIQKYNAVPATLESPYISLNKPSRWTDYNGYRVAWFYPEKTSTVALLLLSKDPSADKSINLGLDEIQICSFSEKDWLPLLGVTKRCASLFGEDLFGVSTSSFSVIEALGYYYENNCKEKGYSSWRSLDAEEKYVLTFFYSDGFYFSIASASQYK